jgi:hypothetical protein
MCSLETADLRWMRSTSRRVMLPPCGAGRPLALPMVTQSRIGSATLDQTACALIEVYTSTVGTEELHDYWLSFVG